jgi:hypothetical protein
MRGLCPVAKVAPPSGEACSWGTAAAWPMGGGRRFAARDSQVLGDRAATTAARAR